MMNQFEYDEMIAEVNSRYDYLSEAFGEEARLIAAQARDEQAAEQAEWLAEQAAFVGPKLPVGYDYPVGPSEEVPF